MNPLGWKREHQLAGLLVCVIGGIVGLLFGWLQTPFSRDQQATAFFLEWISNLHWYWPWPLLGALLAGLTFYVAKLLTA